MKRAKNHTSKSEIHISCSKGQFGEGFGLCARTHTHTQKAINVYFQKIIFGNILPLN